VSEWAPVPAAVPIPKDDPEDLASEAAESESGGPGESPSGFGDEVPSEGPEAPSDGDAANDDDG
ncbi:MAG: hypothetical protein ACTHXO_12470, partial [Actinomycetaceae bacterium]